MPVNELGRPALLHFEAVRGQVSATTLAAPFSQLFLQFGAEADQGTLHAIHQLGQRLA